MIIVGGGVVGSWIARELSRYELGVALVEKETDVGAGTSKANSAIVHTGFDAPPGSLESRLVAEGSRLWVELSRELDIPLRRTGALMVATTPEELELLGAYYEKGQKNGVTDLRRLEPDELGALEPNVNPGALGAMLVPRESCTCPFTAVFAPAENAAANGVRFFLGVEVERVVVRAGQVVGVVTSQGPLEAPVIINAAGLWGDAVWAMAGQSDGFAVTPRKGEFYILDRDVGGFVSHIILPVPTPVTKGILCAPTIDGNLLIGPTAEDIKDKTDTSTTAAGLEKVRTGVTKLVPKLPLERTITQYAGLRAAGNRPDYVIGPLAGARGFFNVVNIRSTGLSAAPAIARHLAGVMAGEGLRLTPKAGFVARREGIPKFAHLGRAERDRLIAGDSRYGNVVCRCETVTEAEVVQAIRRPLGARDLDGVKRRVRAGTGRCQSGFCCPRVTAILARELGQPRERVSKNGPGSQLFACGDGDCGSGNAGGGRDAEGPKVVNARA